MKKKAWIPVLVVVLVLVFLLAGILFWGPYKASTGIYIAADSPVIVFDKGSGEPVVLLAAQGKEDMFEKLQSGDRVLVVHDGTMMLSYPAQMNAFFCFRLKKGDLSRVPEAALDSLEEMGWLEGDSFGQDK